MQEADMARMLTADTTFDRSMTGSATLRIVAESLGRIADEQSLALHAAVEAERPRKRLTELRRLYTGARRSVAR
jgi:hypothetical protein